MLNNIEGADWVLASIMLENSEESLFGTPDKQERPKAISPAQSAPRQRGPLEKTVC